jgi:hypothetical protein
MTNKVDKNQDDSSVCSYILLKFGYSNQYILPIEEALNMIRALAKSQQLTTEYNKPEKVSDKIGDVTIGFMCLNDINQIKVKASLQANTDEKTDET